MKLFQKIERLQRMDSLIRMKCTGSPKAFAEKLAISESTLYENLNELKHLGADITFDKDRCSYIYQVPVKLVFELQKTDTRKIIGGKALLRSFWSSKC